MMGVFLVGVGGGAGAIARLLFGRAYLRLFGPNQPYMSTFFINILGGLAMGLLVGVLARTGASERLRLLLAVGVLGGFTTYSAYALDAALLIERKAYGAAFLYMIGSATLTVVAVFLGLMLVRKWA